MDDVRQSPEATEQVTLHCRVNGVARTATVEARLLLSDFLRHELGLTGTHVGCEHGVCGACTVLLNGRSARSCLTLAAQCATAEIQTIEGLTASGRAAEVQAAFGRHGGLQCGFCTPGFVVSVVELVEDPDTAGLSEVELRDRLAGNLCRCTGYAGIVAATRTLLAGRADDRPATTDEGAE